MPQNKINMSVEKKQNRNTKQKLILKPPSCCAVSLEVGGDGRSSTPVGPWELKVAHVGRGLEPDSLPKRRVWTGLLQLQRRLKTSRTVTAQGEARGREKTDTTWSPLIGSGHLEA